MRKITQILMVSVVMLTSLALSRANAEIELNVLQTFKLDAKPMDVAISLNGMRVFALTENGYLLIYSPDGRLQEKVRVGEGTDSIKATPREDMLLIGNSKEQTLKVILLDLIQTIDSSGLPSKGPADAPFEVVVFSDFECPSCAELSSVLDQVMTEYPERIKVVFMNFPLRSHRFSRAASAAALAAGRQNRFWEFHDALFDNYNRLSLQKINEIARELKLDEARLTREMSHPEVMTALNRDASEAARLGVSGTPTVFVNGRIFRDHSMKSFQTLLEGQPGAPAEK
ncbi:thioredoxin domain-containing protein [Desulfococcus sp.]|uniref:thioredoxin domain-containing protein n=1 Tax=Desulfococcus sp. TaxID=2025834 RepID=UPI003593ACB2